MNLKLRFEPTGTPPQGENNPYTPEGGDATVLMATQLGSVQSYCLRPAYDRLKRPGQFNVTNGTGVAGLYCARESADALGLGVYVLSNAQTQVKLKVQNEVIRSAKDGTCDPSDSTKGCTLYEETFQDGAFERVRTLCRCKSKVYQPAASGGTITAATVYKAILYFQLHEFNNVADVWETGYLDLNYTMWNEVDGEKHATVTGGRIVADPGQVTMLNGEGSGAKFDWSTVSPMGVTGTVKETGDGFWIFDLQAVTIDSHNPKFKVTVEVGVGVASLPAKTVSISSSTDANGTKHVLTGTIDQVNEALSDIRYKLPPTGKTHFNTLSAASQLFGAEAKEKLNVVLDDQGNGGDTTERGTVTRVEFNLLVLGVNDVPVIEIPTDYRFPENSWSQMGAISVDDKDVEDVVGNAAVLLERAAQSPKQNIQVSLDSTYGKYRVSAASAAKVAFLLPLDLVRCAAQCAADTVDAEGVDVPFPSQPITAAQQAALSPSCKACLQAEALRVCTGTGAKSMWVYGALQDVRAVLATLEYKGDAGYNENTPKGGDPFDSRGCARDVTDKLKSWETAVVGANDLGNMGCTTKEAFTDLKTSTVRLTPVEDPPFLIVVKAGESVCATCVQDGTCSATCPGGKPQLVTDEDTVITFDAANGPQVRDFDSRELGFELAMYVVSLNVSQGTLRIAPAGVGPALTFVVGSADCTTCAGFTIRGSMCQVNTALAAMSYMPAPFYNSGFGQPEAILLSVYQVGMASVAPVTLKVDVNVTAVNNVPKVNVHFSKPEGSIPVNTLYYDFLILDGATPLRDRCFENPTTGCISISDPDSCENMYIASGRAPLPSETLAVQQSATAVCRNASSSSGHVKLVFSAVYGDVLFFPASQVTKWPPGDELKPPEGVGKQSRGTSVTLPLAALHGGVLRYYGSASLRRADVATVSAGDFGNSGRPASSGFCCCADKDCASCKAPPCEINFEVTTCQDVPGFTCKDFVETAGSGPVGWVMAIIVMVGVFLVGGTIAGVVYFGTVNASKAFQAFKAAPVEAEVVVISGKPEAASDTLLAV
mmetsp:Transcript_15192/g.36750  ORF Transcript_15192/g.36750 Transcript_15192/m.36750 type:complete len:1051 (+) Transcript_15192:78-3230(+)